MQHTNTIGSWLRGACSAQVVLHVRNQWQLGSRSIDTTTPLVSREGRRRAVQRILDLILGGESDEVIGLYVEGGCDVAMLRA